MYNALKLFMEINPDLFDEVMQHYKQRKMEYVSNVIPTFLPLIIVAASDNTLSRGMRNGKSCGKRHCRIAAASCLQVTSTSSLHLRHHQWRTSISWICQSTSMRCRSMQRLHWGSLMSQGLSVCLWQTLGWMCVRLPLGYERDPRIAIIDKRFLLLPRSIASSVLSLRLVRTIHPRVGCTHGERVHCLVRNLRP